jgi:hypothetical protein
MRNVLSVILMIGMVAVSMHGQSPTPNKYVSGTITAVKTHQGKAEASPAVTRYDISVKVGNTVYVVLYTPPPGTYGAQYSTGTDLLVLVGDKTITFNDVSGVSRAVPIINRSPVSEQSSH